MATRATVHPGDCISCNTCSSVCPVDAIEVRDEGYAYANENCISCGACCLVCPTQCITIESIKEWYQIAKEHNLKSIPIKDSDNKDD
ncbi:MAG: 4Fe-4S dicluster domain-containing protein [Ureaplasma sp.]|nr:4Fe-4S dicluster domain-containing protein [Ureaplasma sp.]